MEFYAFLFALLIASPTFAMEPTPMDSQQQDTQSFAFPISTLKKIVANNQLDNATEWVKHKLVNIKEISCPCGRPYDAHLIILAAEKGHLPLVSVLLDQKAPVNTQRGAPIKKAVQFGHTQMVELLLSKGARVKDAQEGLVKAQRSLPATKAAEIQEIINTHLFERCTL